MLPYARRSAGVVDAAPLRYDIDADAADAQRHVAMRAIFSRAAHYFITLPALRFATLPRAAPPPRLFCR